MTTKDLIKELPAMFQMARDAAGSLDADDAEAAEEFIKGIEALTIAKLKVYAKIETYARKEIADAVKNG